MGLQRGLQRSARQDGSAAAAAVPDIAGRSGAKRRDRPVAGRRGDRGTTAGQDGRAPAVALDYIAESLRALAAPIDRLQPMPGNARAHGPRDLDAIAASLQAHGQQRPIVVARRYRGEEHCIIAGCGTWSAARSLGWRFIAVTYFEGTDAEAAAYSVRDNRTSELSQWSPDALRALANDGAVDLAQLWGDGADLDALLGVPVSDADWTSAFNALPAEDRAPITQMTFTLSDRQAEVVRRALAEAKALGPFADSDNENGNGNALDRIATAFLESHS